MMDLKKSLDGRLSKTTARALKEQGLKYCPGCDQALAFGEFGRKQSSGDGMNDYCRACTRAIANDQNHKHGERKAHQRKGFKRELVAMLGGECVRCGYKEFISGLDFHHVNENEKERNLATNLQKSEQGKQVILQEVDKCALLCRNCHSAYHAGEWRSEWQRRESGFGYTIRKASAS